MDGSSFLNTGFGGTPVVVSDRGAPQELIDRPEIGRVFSGEDPAEVARALVEARVCFLIRVSSQATLYTARGVCLERFRDGEVYYGPGAKQPGAATKPLLRLRLIRPSADAVARIRANPVERGVYEAWAPRSEAVGYREVDVWYDGISRPSEPALRPQWTDQAS